MTGQTLSGWVRDPAARARYVDWLERDLTLVTILGSGHFVQQDTSELVTTTMAWWLGRR